jgi:hypothetical protein
MNYSGTTSRIVSLVAGVELSEYWESVFQTFLLRQTINRLKTFGDTLNR